MSRFSAHRIVLAYTLIVTIGLVALVYLQREQAGEITKIQRQVDRVEKVIEPTLANACMIFARIEREPKACRSEGGDATRPPPSGGGGPTGGGQPPPAPGPQSVTDAVDETVDEVGQAVDGATDTACDLVQNPSPLC